MDRRTFLGILGLLGMPRAASAQPTRAVSRLGLLTPTSATAPPVSAFRQGLRELGWVEGQNIHIEHRFAAGRLDRLPELATELARLRVDVIAAGPTLPAVAAKKATGAIPIVMLGAFQPIELGLVASLAHPGGNVTGLSWSVDAEIVGKGLQLLTETLPKLRRVAILRNPANPAHGVLIEDIKTAARKLEVQLEFLEAR